MIYLHLTVNRMVFRCFTIMGYLRRPHGHKSLVGSNRTSHKASGEEASAAAIEVALAT